jgi:hypothetical protein
MRTRGGNVSTPWPAPFGWDKGDDFFLLPWLGRLSAACSLGCWVTCCNGPLPRPSPERRGASVRDPSPGRRAGTVFSPLAWGSDIDSQYRERSHSPSADATEGV